MELLKVGQTLRQLIHEGTTIQLQRYINVTNFASFRLAAIEKVTTVTTVAKVLRVLPQSALKAANETQSA